jgi:hypothetical protein
MIGWIMDGGTDSHPIGMGMGMGMRMGMRFNACRLVGSRQGKRALHGKHHESAGSPVS